jgi:hypothetical protein
MLLRAMPPFAHPNPVKLRAGFDSIRCARSHYTARVRCETGVVARALWRRSGTSSLPRRTRTLSSGRYARAKLVE